MHCMYGGTHICAGVAGTWTQERWDKEKGRGGERGGLQDGYFKGYFLRRGCWSKGMTWLRCFKILWLFLKTCPVLMSVVGRGQTYVQCPLHEARLQQADVIGMSHALIVRVLDDS